MFKAILILYCRPSKKDSSRPKSNPRRADSSLSGGRHILHSFIHQLSLLQLGSFLHCLCLACGCAEVAVTVAVVVAISAGLPHSAVRAKPDPAPSFSGFLSRSPPFRSSRFLSFSISPPLARSPSFCHSTTWSHLSVHAHVESRIALSILAGLSSFYRSFCSSRRFPAQNTIAVAYRTTNLIATSTHHH